MGENLDQFLGKVWQDDEGIHINVSKLMPPEPMVAILQLIEDPDIQPPVFVHHNRDPIHLYPELLERGWTHQTILQKPGQIILRLTRQT